MKRIRYLPLLWLCLCQYLGTAQTLFTEQVTALQYYYDTDPGVNVAGNGGIVTVSPAASVSASLSLPLPPGLTSGTHFLYMRAKDEYGRWGLPERRSLLIISEATRSDQVTALQYYFDTDPGVGIPGNGAIVNVGPGTPVSSALSISLPPLSAGIHNLYIRAKDEHGSWSIPERRALMILEPALGASEILQLQYYVDIDPGVGVPGNGAILDITPGESISTSIAVDITAFAQGIHQLYVRVKNTNGSWSIMERRPFMILGSGYAQNEITAVQYYFDTDPGVGLPGNGGVIPVTPTESYAQTLAFELPALTDGMHRLYVRTKNTGGSWSIPARHAFFILNTEPTFDIIALEYYFDTDPGVGNGNPITGVPTELVNTPIEIGVPCLSTGTHYAYLRAKDANGHWSIIARDTLTITSGLAANTITPAGPVTICTGDEVVLSTTPLAGVAYQWLLDGTPISGATASAYTVTSSGNYSLKSTCGVAFTTSNVVSVTTLPLVTYYADTDGDGFGDALNTTTGCSAPAGFVADNTDCDDTNAGVHPAAAEICNTLDENCNALIDEGVLITFYADADGDSYGNAATTILACSAPAGYVSNMSDCNDADMAIHPAATEACNSLDDNCNALTDEGVTTVFYADADGDTYGDAASTVNACALPAGFVTDATDCDDADAYAYPGQTWYIDADGDDYAAGVTLIQCARPVNGFNAAELIDIAADCNDADNTIYPTATEVCNGVDDNCSGAFDEGVLITFYADTDTDTYGDAAVTQQACTTPAGYVADNTDCDDNDATAYPGQTYYADADGDLYGSGATTISCLAPAGYSLAADLLTTSGDCDDNDPLINPVAQYYTYSGNLNYNSALVYPPTGDSYDVFQFEVAYFDAANGMPPGSYPRMTLDYENNGIFSNPNDRTIVLTPADPADMNTADGKIYIGSITGLTPGLNWTARIQTGTTCVAPFGPFADFDVIEEPDLELFASDITFSDFEPEPLDEITVFATITNTAVMPAGGFYVRLENQFDGTIFPDVWVNNLNAGASTTVNWTITTPAVTAWCPMLVTIDPTNLITESNELDNAAVRPFVNGDYYVPGGIDATASVSPSIVYNVPGTSVFVSGHAFYYDLAVPLPDPDVAGAQVTLTVVETGATFIGYTNADGYFGFSVPSGIIPGTYHVQGEVTDFTLTGSIPEITFQVIPVPEMPDLETEVVLSASSIVAGGTVDGTITVTNIGNLTSGISTLLDVSQTGGTPVLGDVIVPALAPGASFTHNFYGVTLNVPGWYSFCGNADALIQVDESIEWNNNDCAGVLVVSPSADMYGGGLPGGGVCDVEPTEILFSITNGGLSATGDFESKLHTTYNGVYQGFTTFMTTSILPGQSATISQPFVNYGYGTYAYTVELDHALATAEASEINNAFSWSQTYDVCLPDLKISACNTVNVLADNVYAPTTLDITVSVSNTGDGTAYGPIDMSFDLSDGSTYSTSIGGNIAPGSTQDFVISIPAPVNGTVLTTTVNPLATIAEEAYYNNDHTGDLCWDLAVQPLCVYDFWDYTYVVNSFVYPVIGVHNYDLYHAEDVAVRFELQGPGIAGTMHLGDAILAEVAPTCGSCGLAAVAPSAYMFPEPGMYTFTMTVDPDGDYADCVPGNNQMSVNIYVTGDPDMVVLSEYIHPSQLNPEPGESVTFNITYANNGFENVGETMTMQLLVDDVLMDEITGVPGLLTGDNNTIAAPSSWSSMIEGAHVVKAIIDADEEITESVESNNTATRAIIVGASANPGFEYMVASNPVPVIGESIDIQMSVYNTGETALTADIYLYYVTDDLDTINIGVLPFAIAGLDTIALVFPWIVVDPATTLLAEIINVSAAEYDLTDNKAETVIGAFDVELVVAHESCLGAADGSITVNASGGTEPYVCVWNTGFVGGTLLAAPGTYSVTVTDNTGQSVIASATINASADPVLTYYADADGDNFGNALITALSCSGAPAGFVSDSTDCDDTQASVYPGATEVCNTVDDDCDGSVDEGVLITVFADTDGDSFGDPSVSIEACNAPGGFVSDNTDCNDTNGMIHLFAPEICNAIDDNCDGSVDEGLTFITYFADVDGDSYGDATVTVTTCDGAPAGYVADNTDCNDANASINPGATEICNGVDDDCDGLTDEGVLLTFYADADGDGYGDADITAEACSAPAGFVVNNTDCDDANIAINPGATEVCNAIDDNCDGSVDEGLTFITYYADVDGDSYGDATSPITTCDGAPAGYVADNTDCNDANASINPGATEICNGIDDDCDGSIDEGVLLTFYADADGDGYGDADITAEACSAPAGFVVNNADCDDANVAINPGATEVCNAIDDNCDGSVDEGLTFITYYADVDGDSYGDATSPITTCDGAPAGYVADNTDCNDANATINPGATEICNGVDDDCDGLTDEGVLLTFYADADGDGYGDADITAEACSAPAGFVVNNTDCDDANIAINPGATEVCNAIDDNCDGSVDEGLIFDTYYADADGDGFGDAEVSVESCSVLSGYVIDGTDCDDANAAVHPAALEVPGNGLDDNCDGIVDPGGCSLSVDAGSDESTYFGLTLDQTVSRTASITGGAAPYTVVWTMSRPLLCNVVNETGDEEFNAGSCTDNICPVGATPPVCTGTTITAKLLDTAVVYVTVTDANGCVAVDSFTIHAEDVRCFAGKSGNYKIRMCHMTGSVSNPCVTICIDESAVDAHLAHGDGFGYCNPDCSSRMSEYEDGDMILEEAGILSVYPNPASDHCTLDLHLSDDTVTEATVYMISTTGGITETWSVKLQHGLLLHTFPIGEHIPSGVYTIRVVAGNEQYTASVVFVK